MALLYHKKLFLQNSYEYLQILDISPIFRYDIDIVLYKTSNYPANILMAAILSDTC